MHIIAYNAGSYGQFTGWCLDWMQGKHSENARPFTSRGNSHNNGLVHQTTVDNAITSPVTNSHVHPIQTKSDNLIVQLEKLLSVYDKVVLLYPSIDDFAWNFNNKLNKIWGVQGWIERHISEMFSSSWQSAETWELREWLSISWHDTHMSECRYADTINYSNNRVFKIPINKIRDDFVNTFQSLSKYLELDNIRTTEDLEKLHKDWINNEPHLYKDKLIKDLVYATINNINKEMTGLTILDEADMQRRLRLEGYEIKCHGLNEWPKTTKQLRELIYEADDRKSSI
jgi:hypothetical protein